jgi:hypothetical protein
MFFIAFFIAFFTIIDASYRGKYHRFPQCVASMATGEARATTIKLVSRPAKLNCQIKGKILEGKDAVAGGTFS